MGFFMTIRENDWVYLKVLLSEQMQIDERFLIHPDDVHLIKNDLHFGLLKCISFKDGYYNFIGSENTFVRALKGAVSKKMPAPQFDFEEEVIDLTKSNHLAIGSISNISFHSVRNEYMYFIAVEGKKKSRRYFADELEKR